MIFPPEEVYEGILKEITEEKNERQIGRSNPRAVKSIQKKYPIFSKRHRGPGTFGYTKAREAELRAIITVKVHPLSMPN